MVSKKKLPEKITNKAMETSLSAELEINKEELNEIKKTCIEINMGLKDYLLAIKNGLIATKVTIDKYGEEHVEDDHDKRLKAALMGLEVEGYIRAKGATTDNSKHTHVTVTWGGVPVKNDRLIDVD